MEYIRVVCIILERFLRLLNGRCAYRLVTSDER